MIFKMQQITRHDAQEAFEKYLPTIPVRVNAVDFIPEDDHVAETRFDGVLLMNLTTPYSEKDELFCFNTTGLVNIIAKDYILLPEGNDFLTSQKFNDATKFTRVFYHLMTDKFGLDFYSYPKKYQLEQLKKTRMALDIKKSQVMSRIYSLRKSIPQEAKSLNSRALAGEDVRAEVQALRKKTDLLIEAKKNPDTLWETEQAHFNYHKRMSLWLNNIKKSTIKSHNEKQTEWQ